MDESIDESVRSTGLIDIEWLSGWLTVRLLYEKRKELSDAANKLKNGLFKIDETREKVQTMSGELEEARANVTVFQKQCEEFLVIIVQQKRDADEQQKVDQRKGFV